MLLQKKIILSYTMAILIILPLLSRIINVWFLYVPVLAVLVAVAIVRRGENAETQKDIFKRMQIPLFIGLWISVLYLIDVAFFPKILSLFAADAATVNYINMLAYLLIIMATGLYIYSDDNKVMRIVYIVALGMEALAIAVNEAWGTAFLIFVMLVVHATVIVPIAEVMKRLLQVFFGLAFLFCNMSLIINYSGMIHKEGLKYRLECGVVGELVLCLLALYVFRRWEKIPEEIDLRKIILSRLQKGCRMFLKAGSVLVLVLIVVSLIDGKLRSGGVVQLFAGEQWEQVNENLFVVVMISLLENMYQALVGLWNANVFAVAHQLSGFWGVLIIVTMLGGLCYRLYPVIKIKGSGKELSMWLAAGTILALICLPVSIYMLPGYVVFIFFSADGQR